MRSCPLHDPLAIGLALYSDLATYQTLPARLDMRGELTRELDVERFQALFIQSLTT